MEKPELTFWPTQYLMSTYYTPGSISDAGENSE